MAEARYDVRFVVAHDTGVISFRGPFWMTDEQAIDHARPIMPPVFANFTGATVERKPKNRIRTDA